MSLQDEFIYRMRSGPYDSEPCPFGGNTILIFQKDNENNLRCKCELAERAIFEFKSKNFAQRVLTDDFGVIMKKSGCPHPPKFSWIWHKWRCQCKYNSGEYELL